MVFFSTCFVPHVCIVSFTPCRTALKGRWYSPYLTSEETEAQRSRRNREKEVCFFHYVSGPLEKPSLLKVVGRITKMWKEKSNSSSPSQWPLQGERLYHLPVSYIRGQGILKKHTACVAGPDWWCYKTEKVTDGLGFKAKVIIICMNCEEDNGRSYKFEGAWHLKSYL